MRISLWGSSCTAEVMGVTVTADRWPMALSRVSATTGLACGGAGIDRAGLLRVPSAQPCRHPFPVCKPAGGIRVLLITPAVAGLKLPPLKTLPMLAKRVPDQYRTIHLRPSGSSICGAEQRRIQYDLNGFHHFGVYVRSTMRSTSNRAMHAPAGNTKQGRR
jgi:hypothetical protein